MNDTKQETIRVLVVDDSPFMCHMLTKYLNEDLDITVIDTARDGVEALEKVVTLKPDVVTLDVEMPRMNGLDTLRRIMEQQPTPVIMLSALTQRGARITVQALILGAVDCVAKPSANYNIVEAVKELIPKIKAVAKTTTSKLSSKAELQLSATQQMPKKSIPNPFRSGDKLVIIGASTGGPRALRQLFTELPANFPAAMVVVQHMPVGFTASLAKRLNQSSPVVVQQAAHGDRIAQGLALVVPSGYHLKFAGINKVQLDQSPRRNGVRPALDVSLESAAMVHSSYVIGVVLTGMGVDGTAGARVVKSMGGQIIAEDESTCAVYGMPRSVVEAGLADRIVPLPKVVETLVDMVG